MFFAVITLSRDIFKPECFPEYQNLFKKMDSLHMNRALSIFIFLKP